MLLTATDISRSHGLRTLFRGVSLSLDERERVGLIGPNGSGKSTLLRLLAREESPDEGTVTVARGVRAVYVPQQDEFPPGQSAREIVTRAAIESSGMDAHDAEVLAEMLLGRIGFDSAHATAPSSALSGGWRKRLAIARGLAGAGGEPDILLLDEPTNHLDLAGIRWLESLLLRPPVGRTPFATVFVTHDRAFLQNVATRVVELSAAYPAGTLDVAGDYDEFLRRRIEFLEAQAKTETALANQVRQDNAWLARGAKARRTKAKGRISASAERAEELARLRTRNAAAASDAAEVDFNTTERRTKRLLTAVGVGMSLGGRRLFADLDLELGPGDCLGLLGPNGSGKSTLLGVLTGAMAPQEGSIRRADPPPRIVHFTQQRGEVDPELPLREALAPLGDFVHFGGRQMHVSSWARRFLFRDDQLGHPVRSLSGGELARVHLARLMLEPADILVLDEPTNDLDIPTLEVLEEAIEQFPGAVVLVTHDRAMLERLATSILVLDGAGGARLVASLEQALAIEAATSSRRDEEASASARRDGTVPSTTTAATEPRGRRRKLSFMEQREYEGLEQRILDAEARVRTLEEKLGEPEVTANHARLADTCRALEAAQQEVESLYARWQELEAKISGAS